MPRFAANLTMMYPEYDVPARFEQASQDGFRAVEFLQPYSYSIPEFKSWLGDNDLQLILVNTPMGDVSKGERGLGGLPGREQDFQRVFEQSLEYVTGLGAEMIHVMPGVVPDDVSVEACTATFIANLSWAADLAEGSGVRLQLEPLNHFDLPGYLFHTSAPALDIINQVGRSNVQLQYDFYHLQLTQGNLAGGVEAHLDQIGHIQFSSVPGRHEPQHGEVNLPYLFQFLDDVGYNGWVGCEYRPKTTTEAGLTWAAPYL